MMVTFTLGTCSYGSPVVGLRIAMCSSMDYSWKRSFSLESSRVSRLSYLSLYMAYQYTGLP